MIPSSPQRTLSFLLISGVVFFIPDLLVPAAWAKTAAYPVWYALYQGGVVLAGFWYGPRLGRAMVVVECAHGSLRRAVDEARASLRGRPSNRSDIPVILFEHRLPFVMTAGLAPAGSAIFLSTGQADGLDAPGLRFVLARAGVHATWPLRLVAMAPILALTVALPDTPGGTADWLLLAVLLMGWLALHWAAELGVDRAAARLVGQDALAGLVALLQVEARAPGPRWLHPPATWRLRQAIGNQRDGGTSDV